MPYRRIVLTAFLCWAAQAQQSSQQTAPESVDAPIERTTVSCVLAPVTVKDGAGSIVNG